MILSGFLVALALLVSACGGQIDEEPPIIVEEPPIVTEEPPIVSEEPSIDEARAIEIAAAAGLEPAVKPWRARYYLDPREGYVWSVSGVLRESAGSSEGWSVLIDANTGRVIDSSGWAVIVEEEGVLLIKETREYESLVVKYGSDDVPVRAVNLHDESEVAFLKEINQGFVTEPGCIIVLEAGNAEGYVYQLDEELSIVFRMTLSAFEEGARNVDAPTMERFYSSLE